MNRMSMKSNKKGGRGSLSNRHMKNNTKVQNNFNCGGSNSLNWRTESNKNQMNESNNFGYTNHYVASAFYMLIGLEVEIQKTDRIIYVGILETVSNKVEFHLSHACEKDSLQDDPNKNEKMCKTIIFSFSDVVFCRARSVDLDYAKRDTLLTDSAISGSTNGIFNERELVQWQPDDNPIDNLNSELGDNDTGAVGWAFDEMMRVNEEEHGVKSTFDISMSSYMTPLEKGDSEEFRACEKRAEQVAREIQKDPKFKETENVDSGITEEELFSTVSRTPSNTNNNSNYSMNTNHNSSNSNSPNNNDGFTTYTGKNYRAGRHSKAPQSVVGPRLQRNLRTHEGQNQNQNQNGNHQVNRNHVSSPQRTQNSYQQHQASSQHQQQQQIRIENQHKIPVPHQLQENNIAPTNNNRTQGDIGSTNSARTTLTYSAVAMKKNPNSANNNRVHSIPKPVMPLQPVIPDAIQPIQQLEVFGTMPSPHITSSTPTVANLHLAPISTPTLTSSPIVTNSYATPSPLKTTQSSPISQPQLAAAKQQVIEEAKKKASLGGLQTLPQSTSLVPADTTDASQVTLSLSTTSTVTSHAHALPIAQLNQQLKQPPLKTSVVPITRSSAQNIEVPEKPAQHISPVNVENVDKIPVSIETKTEQIIVPSVSPKDQRSRGEDGKQFLMKYGKMNIAAEEKKGSSLKELKDFGEQFKLEAKPKNRHTAAKCKDGGTTKSPELPIKISGKSVSDNVDGTSTVAESFVKETRSVSSNNIITSSTYSSVHSTSHVTSTTLSYSVAMVSNYVSTSATMTTTPSVAEPSLLKSALNPTAKEFNFNPSAKEFSPVKENVAPPFSPSPKPTLAKQPSFPGEQVQQQMVQHQAYYHSQPVMIHPNGSEVISPTIQSVPVKQIYARPYMSSGPGGPAVYSIPTVEFSNNANSGGAQLIATPQSNYIPTQGMSGQQVIVIHGPNGSYQHVVPGSQGQQYYQMQQMIRCVHPGGSGVQQIANRVPGNFQPDAAPQGYVLAVSQHGGLVQHQVPTNQHQGFHPPQSPGQSSHIQTQYAMAHQVATSYPQNPSNAAASPITYTQGVVPKRSNSGSAYRSPSSIHTVAGQHHPQQSFVMMTHQGQHIQTVAMANTQTYVQGQSHGGGGILQNYQTGN